MAPNDARGPATGYLRDNLVYGRNTHLATGILGTKYLFPWLTRIDNSDLAYDLATQTTYPSWGYMVKRGATTLWELWQEKTGPSMNSHDHAMYGSVGAWFYQALAGINIAGDGAGDVGYRQIRIAPQIVEDLESASGTVETVRGTVSSSWSHSPGVITVKVPIPVSTNPKAFLPSCIYSAYLTTK